MKTIFKTFALIIWTSVTLVPALADADELTAHQKFPLHVMIRNVRWETLCAADANCPTNRTAAITYYAAKIDACTNTAQLLALSNSIAVKK